MANQLQLALKILGFSEHEALVYLACLGLGQAKLQELARVSKLPRATVHSVLQKLKSKGYVSGYDVDKILHYAPLEPTQLKQRLKDRLELLDKTFPELSALYQAARVQPQVSIAQGVEQIEEVYRDILKQKKLKTYDIYAAESMWLSMSRKFVTWFKYERAKRGIKTRLILDYSPDALARKAEQVRTNSDVKVLPSGFTSPFTSGLYIFQHKVIFVGYRKEHIAVTIESPELTQLLQSMFDGLWRLLPE